MTLTPQQREKLLRERAEKAESLAAGEEERADIEAGRAQDAIYKLIQSHVPKPDLIDGGGCDSGDWLDLTLSEIGQGIAQLREQTEVAESEHDTALRERDQARQECERLREGWLAEDRQREEKHAAVRKAGGVYQRLNGELFLLIADSPLLKTLEARLASAISSLTQIYKIAEAERGRGESYKAIEKLALASLTSETQPKPLCACGCGSKTVEFSKQSPEEIMAEEDQDKPQ